ncbi:MAG: hypothetical protein BroJett003_08670 [Planctomycetota bacterium]|nr:MAG: hypothetical protein BroJett003_08670 [Planctomycetota bacterium]
MNLIPWRNKDPDRAMQALMPSFENFRIEMDRLFSRFFSEPLGFAGAGRWLELTPRVDLADTESAVEVKVEVPGVEPKDIDIEVADNVLFIRGQKVRDREEKKRNYYYVEREQGSFSRSIPLPASVNADQVDATFKDGVLTVTLPKKPGSVGRKVPVRNA